MNNEITYFSDIYDEFKDKITDYNLMLDDDILDEILFGYLKKACSRFKRICETSLEFDEYGSQQFQEVLSFEEIDILTTWMVYFWVTPYVNNSDNLQNILNTKDFTQFSPANLTSTLKNVQKESYKEARSLMNEYSIVHGDLEKLKRN